MIKKGLVCVTILLALVFGLSNQSSGQGSHVELVGRTLIRGEYWDVVVVGDAAYCATRRGIEIFGVSDSSAPTLISLLETPNQSLGLAVFGDYAYIADSESGLRIIDVSNPTSPAEIGFFDTPNVSNGITISGNFAYVTDNLAGLRVIDIGDPGSPTEVGFYDTPGQAVDVSSVGELIFVADIYSPEILRLNLSP